MEVGESEGKVICSLHHRLKNYDATHQILTDFVSLIIIYFKIFIETFLLTFTYLAIISEHSIASIRGQNIVREKDAFLK
jgi:hypothetical protein